MTFPVGGYVDLAAAEADGVLYYYKFDELSGSTFASYGTYASPGIVTNDVADATITAGAFGNARQNTTWAMSGSTPVVYAPELGGVATDGETNEFTFAFVTDLDYTTQPVGQNVPMIELVGVPAVSLGVALYSGVDGGGVPYITVYLHADTVTFKTKTYSVSGTGFDGTVTYVAVSVVHDPVNLDNSTVTLWYGTDKGIAATTSNSAAVAGYRPTQGNRYFTSGRLVALAMNGAYIDEFTVWNRAFTATDYTNLSTGPITEVMQTFLRLPQEEVVSEVINLLDLAETFYRGEVLDISRFGDSSLATVLALLSDTLGVSANALFSAVSTLRDMVRLSPSVTAGGIEGIAVNDIAVLRDLAALTFPQLLTEAVQFSDITAFLRTAVSLLQDELVVGTSLAVRQSLGVLIASAVVLGDRSLDANSGLLTDDLQVGETLAGQIVAMAQLLDAMIAADTSSPLVVISATQTDGVDLADTTLPQLTTQALLSSGVELSIVVSDGSEVFTGLVMNTKNFGVTEYSNYGFNSFAALAGYTLAANKYGLYRLGGDTDAGTQIDSIIKTARIDVANGSQTRVEKAYVGVLSSGKMVLKTITGDEKVRWYKSSSPRAGSDTLSITLGRGVKSRYWQFELSNTAGGDFLLEDIELMPVALNRR